MKHKINTYNCDIILRWEKQPDMRHAVVTTDPLKFGKPDIGNVQYNHFKYAIMRNSVVINISIHISWMTLLISSTCSPIRLLLRVLFITSNLAA